MRNAKRHNHYGRNAGRSLDEPRGPRKSGSCGPRFWYRLALIAALGWLASNLNDHSAPSSGSRLSAQDKRPVAAQHPAAYCFDVPLPITDAVEKSVTRRVERAIRQLTQDGKAAGGGRRPVVIFEFRPASGTAGEGSSFGDAVDLARFISGDRLSGVETVAWVPKTVKGHAVLPVLACEKIIMAKDAELGAAGLNEKSPIEIAIRSAYTEYPARHRTVPPAIALGLLDKDLAVYRVTPVENTGIRYETAADLQKLRDQGAVSREETFFQPGDPHLLSGAKMRECLFATHLADSR